jgi:oligopeptidase A
MTEPTNPLLELRHAINFASIDASHVMPAVESALGQARHAIDQIAHCAQPRSFENTMLSLDAATEDLELVMHVVSHLESVNTSPALRQAHMEAEEKTSAFFSSIPLNAELWGAIEGFSRTNEAAGLTGERKRYLTETIRSFVRAGARLPEEQKLQLHALDVELTKTCTQFAQNVLDSTNAFELIVQNRDRLRGVPEAAVQRARDDAARRGQPGYRLTLQAPSYLPVMTYAEDATLRETLYRAYSTRATTGAYQNQPLVQRILELRKRKAALLGFANFADLVIDDRMARTGEIAERFVRDLATRTRPFFDRENEELLEFRRTRDGASATGIMQPWDVAYYAEQLRQSRFAFDEEELRPYFVAEHVLQGVFEIATRLYGVTIRPNHDAAVWHPDVRAFEFCDSTGHALGTFYVDLFPRETKRDGAWMNGLRLACGNSTSRTHVIVLCANLTPPGGDRPSLLNLREVETVFHEFGHLLHHALSHGEIRSLAGTNVAWDFVELPSQIMENWVWEREGLDLFAKHVDTAAGLPTDLFDKMLRSRTFRAANATMRQLGFAHADLALHRHYRPEIDGDAVRYARSILAQYSPAALPDDHATIASFSHLFAHPTGYAAGYYSYKWAEVLDADAFTRFKREGIFNPRTGASFRDEVLSKGNSAPADELYRNFMGRDPDLAALLARAGLVPTPPHHQA